MKQIGTIRELSWRSKFLPELKFYPYQNFLKAEVVYTQTKRLQLQLVELIISGLGTSHSWSFIFLFLAAEHRMLTESMNEWRLFQLSVLCLDDYIFGTV